MWFKPFQFADEDFLIQVEDVKGLPSDQYLVLKKNRIHGNKKKQIHGKKRRKKKHPKKNVTKKSVVGNDYMGFFPDDNNPDTAKSQQFISNFVQQNYLKSG